MSLDDPADQPPKFNRGVFWQTKDGTLIRIKDMEHSHLGNTLRMMIRSAANYRMRAISSGNQILATMQGELAIEDIERGIERYENSTEDELADQIFGPAWRAMNKEADKRGLRWRLDEDWGVHGSGN